MKVALSAESQCDLSKEDCEKYHVNIVHMNIEKNGVNYRDDEIPLADLFAWSRQSGKICHTAATNIAAYEEHFANLLKDHDEILHIAISSGLSSGYANAVAAANGDPRIHVVDSLNSSGGTGVYVLYCAELIENGYTAAEAEEALLERRGKINCSFQIDTLEFLYRGGRCSKLAMFGANILKIKPQIDCKPDGKLAPTTKRRGPLKKVVKEYFDDVLALPNIDKKRCVIECSTLEKKEYEEIFDSCVQRLKDFGFENVHIGFCTPISAYHAGPNIIGVQFMIDGPHPVNKKN